MMAHYVLIVENINITCQYLIGRRCLLKHELIEKPFATLAFCRDNCEPNNLEKQKAMLKNVYGIELNELPEAAALQKEYAEHKGCGSCGKVKNIVKGFGRYAWDSIAAHFGGKPDDWVIERAEICSTCEYRTFLSVIDWAIKGIDITKIIKLDGVFSDTDLPIDHEAGQFKTLWCAKCKCCINAKVRAKDEKCLIGKWVEIDKKLEGNN